MPVGPWVRRKLKPKCALGVLFSIAIVAQASMVIEALVRARLRDEMFDAPTRIYARPTVLKAGLTVDRARVEDELRRQGYRRTGRYGVGIGEYYLGSRTWVIGRRAFRHGGLLDAGGVAIVRIGYRGRVSSVSDASGRLLRHVIIEPALLRSTNGSSHEDRLPVPLSAVPDHLVSAVLSIEDQRFFEHEGLDLLRIGGAAIANVRAGGVVQGASTLTQQLAKNLFLSPRRTASRKLREMLMATVLERRHSKEEILEAYLNEIYLGQDGAYAIHGVGRAAQYYFGKDVSQLDLVEAALLAGLIRGPSLYSPFRNPEAAKKRRNVVLGVMHDGGIISESAYRVAREAALGLRDKPEQARSGRYFVDFAAAQLTESLGAGVWERGLAVFTTLDMNLQRVAEQAVRDGLARLEASYPGLGREDTPLQAALVALDPRSGEVLAMVGGRDYGASQFNRAVNARRQPGSSFKPIVALAALSRRAERREGGRAVGSPRTTFTLATLLEDQPLSVETPVGVWQPVNYDRQFRGRVTLRDALERSLNVPFARLGIEVGAVRIVETARSLGIASRLNPVPSLAIGSSEVTPLEMTRAFGVLAANGFRSDLHTSLAVVDGGGDVVSRLESGGEQVFDPAQAYLVTSALRGAVERGTGRGLRRLGYRGPVAAKSGTTNDFRDAWFIGYTPSLAVGVWVGFDDGQSIGVPGSRAALPIFARFLVGALGRAGDSEFRFPAGLEVVDVNPETGLRAGPGCRGEPEVFIRGTAPEDSCSRYWTSRRSDRRWRSRWRREVGQASGERRRRAGRGRN